MLYYETVDLETLVLLQKLQDLPIFKEMRLVGGTSLALQIGHRKSIDIDLFGKLSVEYEELVDEIKTVGHVIQLNNSKNIHGFLINNIKVDIVNYEYNWLRDKITYDNIHLASIEDIAAMKLNAIIGRGSKKDFIDLYYILNNYTLSELMAFYDRKYLDGSRFLVLKSLVYFEDAETEVMPFMFNNISWQNVKAQISKVHADYVLNN
jgi:predicted nucleotidyltransferase